MEINSMSEMIEHDHTQSLATAGFFAVVSRKIYKMSADVAAALS